MKINLLLLTLKLFQTCINSSILLNIDFFPILLKSMGPMNGLVTIFFKISSFVLSRREKHIQVWNNLRVSK